MSPAGVCRRAVNFPTLLTVVSSNLRTPEVYNGGIACFLRCQAPPLLRLFPDGLDRPNGKIGSIQVNVVPAVLGDAVLTVGRKRGRILL